jgi:hypothetical protein
MTLVRSTCIFSLFVVACATRAPSRSTEVPPPVVQPSAEPGSGGDARATCVATFQRQRECTSDFIPQLVALRVRLDVPGGIADKDREIGRDALVAKAMEEWKSDSTDEAIGATCDQLAGADPDGVAKGGACLAKSACGEFVDCLLPIIETHLRR